MLASLMFDPSLFNSRHRRTSLLLLFTATACAGLRTNVQTLFEQRPNIIVILADDIGAEALACYGGESYATPQLDRLASEGTRFTNAFTQPLCTPTRIELLTGRSNGRNYRAFSVLDPNERTFAHELQGAGYRTLAVGKWQLLAAEHYEKAIRGSGTKPEHAGFDRHTLWQVEALGNRHWSPRMTIDGVLTDFDEQHYGPDVALQSALDWIDESSDAPYLLFWPMILPHGPFLAPPGTEGQRTGKSDKSMYGPMVEYMDALVGQLAGHLRGQDAERETLLLFIGDNGSPQGIVSVQNGREVKGGKAIPTDAGSRIPFIAWAPDSLNGGETFDELVSTVDVFATLLQAAGIQSPDDRVLESRSFLAALFGQEATSRDWVRFHHHPRPNKENSKAKRWARDKRWQLFDDNRLYDMSVDPNLKQAIAEGAASKEAQAARATLSQALATLPRPD
ncbi:MAG: arylsulfatase A [Planctomycetota bacterium]|jgi:arylsulfatase A